MGYQCALNLASRGCRIIIADVVDSKHSVKTIIEKTGNPNIKYMHLDLASFASVRKFAATLKNDEKRLDILINNAGCGGFDTKSEDGIYKVLQINYLGHFLLTHLLASLLKETKKSRVVFVSSLLAFTNDLKSGDTINRLTKLPHFDETFNYGNSKAAMLASVNIFAERFKQHGVLVAASHPGIVDTGIFTTCVSNTKKNDFKMRLFYGFIFIIVKLVGKTPVEGIQSTLHCTLASKVQPGAFIVDCMSFPKPWMLTDEFCKEIWAESLRLAAISEDEEIK